MIIRRILLMSRHNLISSEHKVLFYPIIIGNISIRLNGFTLLKCKMATRRLTREFCPRGRSNSIDRTKSFQDPLLDLPEKYSDHSGESAGHTLSGQEGTHIAISCPAEEEQRKLADFADTERLFRARKSRACLFGGFSRVAKSRLTWRNNVSLARRAVKSTSG